MSIPKPNGKYMNASEVVNALSILTEVDKKEVKAVLTALKETIIPQQLKTSKAFALHGCAKLVTKRRKARKAGKGRNPFTGEPCVIKARPACNVVRARPLKALKDVVA